MKDLPETRVRLPLPLVLLFAVVHGALFVLAFPPASWWVCTIIAPIALALACTLAGRMRDLLGTIFVVQLLAWGFLHWWVLEVTVPGYFALVVYLALWSMFEAFLLRWLTRSSIRVPLPLALPVVLLGMDWLRGTILFDGYPWYLRPQPLVDVSWFASMGALGGIWLPGILALFLSGVIASFLRWWWETGSSKPAIVSTGINMVIAVGAILLVHASWGTNDHLQRTQPRHTMLLVQTNLPTDNKIGWQYERQIEDIPAFIRQTHDAVQEARARGERVELAVWPETMLPSVGFEIGDEFSDAIERTVEALGVPMLVGSPCYLGVRRDETGTVTWDHHYNSAYLVGGDGPPYARVDKVFLTPFGETMPYISAWPWLQEQLLAIGAKGMSFDLDAAEQIARLTLPVEGETRPIRIAVPICFEDTMAPVVRRMVWEDGARRADVLVNISNDGWFGSDDAGRAMHVLCARWRAIENRTWMLRAVNTGLTVAIAPDGRVTQRVESGPRTSGTLLARFAMPDDSVPLHARIGGLFGGLSALVLGVLVFSEWWYTWRRRSRRAGGTPE